MKATIEITGKKYEATGETVKETLAKFDYRGFAKLKGILTVSNGKEEKTVVLYPIQTMQIGRASCRERV